MTTGGSSHSAGMNALSDCSGSPGAATIVCEQEWEQCGVALRSAAATAQGTPRQKHVDALSAIFPLIQQLKVPKQQKLREMATLLRVRIKGKRSATLFRDVQVAFVDAVLEKSSDEHPAFARLLKETLELGHMPKEWKTPLTARAKAETKLRAKIRYAGLTERIQGELDKQRVSKSASSESVVNVARNQDQSASPRKRLRMKTRMGPNVADLQPMSSWCTRVAQATAMKRPARADGTAMKRPACAHATAMKRPAKLARLDDDADDIDLRVAHQSLRPWEKQQ